MPDADKTYLRAVGKEATAGEQFRLFCVVESIMRDAAGVLSGMDNGSSTDELAEKLHLVAHYIDYTRRYCAEYPFAGKQEIVG